MVEGFAGYDWSCILCRPSHRPATIMDVKVPLKLRDMSVSI